MAVDINIDNFSIDLFRNLWCNLNIDISINSILKRFDNKQIICSDSAIICVISRRIFFSRLMYKDTTLDYEVYSKSSLDFYLYLQKNMKKYVPYQDLNIFDKIFMAGAVAFEMSRLCCANYEKKLVDDSPICFAMYFDNELKEEFYEKGGWNQLEMHAESYKSRVLTFFRGNIHWCLTRAFYMTLNIEYSPEIIENVFIEKLFKGKSKVSCTQCLPLFEAVKMLSSTIETISNDYKFNEGFLQIIRHMSSQEEKKEIQQRVKHGPEFKNFEEMLDIGFAYEQGMKQNNSELIMAYKIEYDNSVQYLEKYKTLNSYGFLSRLFIDNDYLDDSGSQCMFCGCNVNELPKDFNPVSDHVDQIKSVLYDTLFDVEMNKSTEACCEAIKNKRSDEEDDDERELLQLFFSLGVEPNHSKILMNLRRNREQNLPNSEAAKGGPEVPNSEAAKGGPEEKTKKKKNKKNKSKKK